MSNSMNEFIERISKLSPKRLVLLAAELQSRLQAAEQAAEQTAALAAELGTEQAAAIGAGEAIAVIGLGLRFPGGVQSPEDFWQFLLRGGDGIRACMYRRIGCWTSRTRSQSSSSNRLEYRCSRCAFTHGKVGSSA